MQWEIDFFPRGTQYPRALLINVFYTSLHPTNSLELPEAIFRSVRVRCTCRSVLNYGDSIRFKIAIVVYGAQSNISYLKTLHTRIQYFSRENRALVIDNLIPYEELDLDKSMYLLGKNRDVLKVLVIITPFPSSITQESPPLDFK